MRKLLNIGLFASVLCVIHVAAFPATTSRTKTQSAIQKGTNVRAKVAPNGLYSKECYDAYYGCMDQFCIPDNGDGGSCMCSDDHAKYEKELEGIKEILANANDISTVEVERIRAGAQADIIFSGTRQYDEKGNVILTSKTQNAEENKAQKKRDLMALFETTIYDEDVFGEEVETLAAKTGNALYNSSHQLCMEMMPASCSKDMTLLTQIYSSQIKSDCIGFANDVTNKKLAAEQELASAQADVRGALRDSFNAANEYDRGTCMVNFKKCMQTNDACGSDWSNCVSTIASENMQNQKAVSTAGTKVKTVIKYDIADSTMEILEAKRNICENVLDKCVAVRDMIWPDFLREAAPTIKVAELNAESKMRMSCLTDISDCIQKACKDDIVGKGVATMDSCLSRPEMVRSFCKVQVDTCERMEPLIWGYVKDKLAAMRVDACTAEVKECFTSEDRCGEDFSKCIGMDYDYIHDICPIDKLVVCKANNPKFSMNDLDSMLMGLYLNIDNSALETCQNLVDQKMMEICGSTTDCNKFASDDVIGTGSLNYQKDGAIHRLTGMLSFGQIKTGNGMYKVKNMNGEEKVLGAGEIDLREYFEKIGQLGVPDKYLSVVDTVYYELENIQGTINRTIEMIEQDPKIQYCISGRDLSQITGRAEQTTARFPKLLNQVKMQIAIAALRQANDNYNKKYTEYISKLSRESSADMANLMCNKLPFSNGSASGIGASDLTVGITTPYAIVFEMAGIDNVALAAGGTKSSMTLGGATVETASGNAAGGSNGGKTSTVMAAIGGTSVAAAVVKGAVGSATGAVVSMNPAALIADSAVKAIGILASDKHKVEFDGGTREMWSLFNRETRNCHYCTSTITKDCKTKGSRGFLGLWDSRGVSCTSSDPVEKCEDIPM